MGSGVNAMIIFGTCKGSNLTNRFVDYFCEYLDIIWLGPDIFLIEIKIIC